MNVLVEVVKSFYAEAVIVIDEFDPSYDENRSNAEQCVRAHSAFGFEIADGALSDANFATELLDAPAQHGTRDAALFAVHGLGS